jgi:hypothetical protein
VDFVPTCSATAAQLPGPKQGDKRVEMSEIDGQSKHEAQLRLLQVHVGKNEGNS